MDSNLVLGVVMIGYGLLTLVGRFVGPGSAILWKLDPMKERWGETAGLVMHWVSYTVLPLALGSLLVWASLSTGRAP